MTHLLQALHEARLAGRITWRFDGAFTVSLRGEELWSRSAVQCTSWLYAQSRRSEAGNLTLIQKLHDAELAGSIEWGRESFRAELDGVRGTFTTWDDVEVWLRAKGNDALRKWLAEPDRE